MIALAKKRGEYIELFFRALVSPKDKALKAMVAAEDAKLEVDEIIHFRKLAYAKYVAALPRLYCVNCARSFARGSSSLQ